MHPTDVRQLQENFRKLISHKVANGVELPSRGKRVMIQRADGFAGLKSLLPPPSRRGLILIDPSYEDKDDYRKVKVAIEDAMQRFATGTYAIWYPVLGRLDSQQLPERLKRVSNGNWLNVTLTVGSPTEEGMGLRSSGMLIINPPWTLQATLKDTMPYLVDALGVDDAATFSIQVSGAETAKPTKDRTRKSAHDE
jgi:23S rRNA (adenine2030-N6)-methyltransferase